MKITRGGLGLLALTCIVAVGFAGGCLDQGPAPPSFDQARAMNDQLNQLGLVADRGARAIEDLQKQMAELGASQDQQAAAQKMAEPFRAEMARLADLVHQTEEARAGALASLKAAEEKANAPPDPGTAATGAGIGAAVAAVGGPWGALFGAAIPTVFALVERFGRKRAQSAAGKAATGLLNIVGSIEKVVTANPDMGEKFLSLVGAQMPTEARAIVNWAKGNKSDKELDHAAKLA